MVELVGIILTLSIEILVGGTFCQLLKATSRKIMIQPNSYRFIIAG